MNRADTMQAAVQRYLDERHLLGFALKSPGTELMRFARFADARDHQGPLTLDLQLNWACEVAEPLRQWTRQASRMSGQPAT